ncbi:DUF4192 domain-containing protein [Nocardia sp. CNY236]|uniref:DUF4192 domain-containing protein n=1 Tax=Nocardia sp. CNY236 TaxID=1169152 RepID=UPI00055FA0F9|nr:DUF4192 domain-containing protein [Nocardia sp. CNY236]
MHDPGELICAVPAMLGFTPQRSIVVFVLRRRGAAGAQVYSVVRFDLDSTDDHSARAEMVATAVARICAQTFAVDVFAVLVDDRMFGPRPADPDCRGGADDGQGALGGALGDRLATFGVELGAVWAIRMIAGGQRWWTLLGSDRHGVLPDPAASPVALLQVLDGRPLRGSRAELTSAVSVDPQACAEVADHLRAALDLAGEQYARAAREGDPRGYVGQALDYVLWQVATVASGATPTPPELAKLAATLRVRAVRDAMFALAVGEHAGAAEQLWGTLTRALSGTDRADAAVLLAYSAYVRGDGPLAGIALEAALAADSGHSMAGLLDAARRVGMHPRQLRRLARSGYRIAGSVGVDLERPRW